MTSFKRLLPWLTYGWALAILFVSVMPAEELPSLSIWEPDKIMHGAVYAILTWLFAKHLQQGQYAFKVLKSVIVSAIVCIAYGFCIELIQLAMATRQFDLYDALANTIGSLVAMTVVLVISGNRKQHTGK